MDGADEQAQAYKPADPYADRVMIWYPEDTDGLPDDLRAALETGLCLTSAQRNRFFALADARAAASAPGETAPSPSEGGERGADAAARAECGSEVAAAAAGAGRACARAGLSGRGVSQREKPPPKRHRVARLPKHTMTCRKNAQAMSRFKAPWQAVLPNGGTMQVDNGAADVASSAEVAALNGSDAAAASKALEAVIKREKAAGRFPEGDNWVICSKCRHLSTQEPASNDGVCKFCRKMLGKLLPGAVAVAAPLPTQP